MKESERTVGLSDFIPWGRASIKRTNGILLNIFLIYMYREQAMFYILFIVVINDYRAPFQNDLIYRVPTNQRT